MIVIDTLTRGINGTGVNVSSSNEGNRTYFDRTNNTGKKKNVKLNDSLQFDSVKEYQ